MKVILLRLKYGSNAEKGGSTEVVPLKQIELLLFLMLQEITF